MKLSDFLMLNPTYRPSDLEHLRINGEYDEKALQALHNNIRMDDDMPLVTYQGAA